jgi:hypothetical protein
MALREHFEELENLISGSAELAKIRNKLYWLCDQSEAAEMDVQRLNSKVHEYERRIAHFEEHYEDPDEVDELGLRFLRVLFDKADALSIEQITQALDLPKAKVEHCRDVLIDKKMIEKAGEGRSGFSGDSRVEDWRSDYFGLSVKGRKYVAEGS